MSLFTLEVFIAFVAKSLRRRQELHGEFQKVKGDGSEFMISFG